MQPRDTIEPLDTSDAPPLLLLGCFAEFYEEVARIKQHAVRGDLPDYLGQVGQVGQVAAAAAPSMPAGDAAPDVLARAASARLLDVLAAQRLAMRRHGTEAQQRHYAQAVYVMVALADEIFIFDLAWPAQQAWLAVLLEHSLFASRLAGRRFFEQAEAVLQAPVRDALQCDLASCFLLALQLGFKGMHRGAQGIKRLDELRHRLWRFVNGSSPPVYAPVLFPQAYAHTVVSSRDERIAPLKPWWNAARWWLLGFLLVSSALWLWLARPLIQL
ncbi:MAG: DotU family type IV/VI secretion system protein [Rubrivivax sp.]|nr:DotU family type IV/VI secretion system protein [Rubrivivax sp.]